MLRFLINLDESCNRLQQIKKQLDRLRISFERISAVNGKNLDRDLKKSITYPIDHFETKVRFTRELTNGEIGCFLSHRHCWKRLLESKEQWALIMEDDILISSHADKYLRTSSWIPDDVKICQISCLQPIQTGRIQDRERPVDSFLSLIKPTFPTPLGTQAYWVSREFAKRALELSIKLPAPVDNFMFSPWFKLSNEFQIWKTNPVLVIPSPSISSEIGERGRKNVRKAPFWIRHGFQRILMDFKIKKTQSKGENITIKFIP